MTIQIRCHKCNNILYSGMELKSPREILKKTMGRCSKCQAELSLKDFKTNIIRND